VLARRAALVDALYAGTEAQTIYPAQQACSAGRPPYQGN
jgi:hypothetical protein